MAAKSESQRTIGAAGLIGMTAFAGALVGFVLQLLVAYYFGASKDTDAFFMAQSTSEMLSKLLLGGSIAAVFLPMFVERITRGARAEAWQLGLNIFHLTGAAVITLAALMAVFAYPFVHFIAPGFDAETTALTVRLLRVLIPSFVFMFLVDLAVSMLYSLKRFAVPSALRIVAPLVSVLFLAIFAPSLGVYALALGVLAGSAIQLAVVFSALVHEGLRYRFVWNPFDPAIRRLLYLVYPFVFSVLVTQAAGIVYRILVSDLAPGSLSALKYAEKITQFLTVMFLGSVTTVIYPLLSEKASKHDMTGMRATLSHAVRLTVFVSVPLLIGVALLREPLIALAYQHGSFSEQDAAVTGIALLFLVIGLTTNGISSIFGHATLALQQTRASVAVTCASQVVAISLFVLLVPYLGVGGLALASSLVPISIALLYFIYLTRFIPRLYRVFVHPTYFKITVLAVCLAGVVLFTRGLITDSSTSTLSLLVRLLVPTVLGCLVFFGGAYLWRVEEMRDVLAIAGRAGKKFRVIPKSLYPEEDTIP